MSGLCAFACPKTATWNNFYGTIGMLDLTFCYQLCDEHVEIERRRDPSLNLIDDSLWSRYERIIDPVVGDELSIALECAFHELANLRRSSWS